MLTKNDIQKREVKRWLDNYKEAWENGNTEILKNLFTENAIYQETPFSDPIKGINRIVKYWEDEDKIWKDVDFSCERFWVLKNTFFAKWNCRLKQSATDSLTKMDGIFLCFMESSGKVYRFEEYWHIK